MTETETKKLTPAEIGLETLMREGRKGFVFIPLRLIKLIGENIEFVEEFNFWESIELNLGLPHPIYFGAMVISRSKNRVGLKIKIFNAALPQTEPGNPVPEIKWKKPRIKKLSKPTT